MCIRDSDKSDGPIPLDPGLLSTDGWTVVDDSQTPVLEDGWIAARGGRTDSLDLYFFGYGHDFSACLRDFRQVSGAVPVSYTHLDVYKRQTPRGG